MKIRFIEPDNKLHDVEEPEEIRVRMLCSVNAAKEEYFRIELTSETDVFFFYTHM